MPAQHDLTLIPEDVLRTSRLNEQERKYIMENMGKSRRDVEISPPDRPANASACAFVLDRMRDEIPEVQGLVKERLKASLEFDKVMEGRRAQFGYVDYDNIGIGAGVGQHSELDIFDVVLSEKTRPKDGVDWASIYRSEDGGPVVVNPKALLANRKVECQWCDHVSTGERAVQVMGKHVSDAHRDNQKEWREKVMPQIKKQFETVEGMIKAGAESALATPAVDPRIADAALPTPGGTTKMDAKDV